MRVHIYILLFSVGLLQAHLEEERLKENQQKANG